MGGLADRRADCTQCAALSLGKGLIWITFSASAIHELDLETRLKLGRDPPRSPHAALRVSDRFKDG